MMPRLLLLLIVSFTAPAVAAETDPDRDILVTFENVSARATTTGAPYRGRKRYAISPDARRQADAIAEEYGLQKVDHWPIRSLS